MFGANYSSENTYQSTYADALGDSITRLVTNQLNSDFGLSYDHLWNPDDFSSALSLLGQNVSPAQITATGDQWYEWLSGVLDEPMIFGPSFAGVEWTEAIQNKGDFTNWGIYGDVQYHVNERLDLIAGLRYSEDEKEFSWLFPPTSFAALRPGVSNQIFTLDPEYASAYTTPLKASDNWSQTTGRAVAQYQLTEGPDDLPQLLHRLQVWRFRFADDKHRGCADRSGRVANGGTRVEGRSDRRQGAHATRDLPARGGRAPDHGRIPPAGRGQFVSDRAQYRQRDRRCRADAGLAGLGYASAWWPDQLA